MRFQFGQPTHPSRHGQNTKHHHPALAHSPGETPKTPQGNVTRETRSRTLFAGAGACEIATSTQGPHDETPQCLRVGSASTREPGYWLRASSRFVQPRSSAHCIKPPASLLNNFRLETRIVRSPSSWVHARLDGVTWGKGPGREGYRIWLLRKPEELAGAWATHTTGMPHVLCRYCS